MSIDRRSILVGVCAAVMAACGGGSSEVVSLRLVDIFSSDMVQGAPSAAAPPASAHWEFAEGQDLQGWTAAYGVADLKLVDGKLTGRSTSDVAVIYVATPADLDAKDTLFAVEVRQRTSGGTRVSAATRNNAEVTFNEDAVKTTREGTPPFQAPLTPGEEFQTLTMTSGGVSSLGSIKVLFIRPTDAPDQTFEIESVRLISQGDHSAEAPTSVGWQGLGNIFRESISMRSPERVAVELDIPQNSWLDLHVGAVDDQPVTFRIDEIVGDNRETILDRTITTPHRWEDASLDLSGRTGHRKFEFYLDADQDFRTGFWGSPVVRVRNASAQVVKTPGEALGGVRPPKSVIFLMCDTLRRDHLNVYGYGRETAPNLARIASQGTVFLDNVSQATWTKASAPSLLTSLYPSSTRVMGQQDRLSASATTIAEVYRAAGYATVSFSSVAFTGKLSNLHQGYEELHEAASINRDPDYGPKTAREYVDRASDWIERHSDTPFFMYLHVFDPHARYEPRPPYNTMWSDAAGKEKQEADRAAALKGVRRSGSLPYREDLEKASVDPKQWVDYEQGWYDGSIRGMDAELGRFLQRIEELGLQDDILFAFVSDHGDEFQEHGGMWHGHTTYAELNQVPLVLYRPGVVPAGVQVKETVRNIDLMPTLLDLSGLQLPEYAQGQSLVPLIAATEEGGDVLSSAAQKGWAPEPAVTEKNIHPDGENPKEFESYGLIAHGWKIVHNVQGRGDKNEFELYDHAADPKDLVDVAAANPDMLEKLKTELQTWHNMVQQNQLPTDASPEAMTPDEADRLRSLGYIQ